MKIPYYKLLLILLLIVGCEEPTKNDDIYPDSDCNEILVSSDCIISGCHWEVMDEEGGGVCMPSVTNSL